MYRIGVDIGGTNIAFGLLDEKLDILSASSIPFVPGGQATATAIAGQIGALLQENDLQENEIAGIGLAVPGSVNYRTSMVIDAYNLGFHDLPLRDMVQAGFPGIPVRLANDADAATLAELHKGALRGYRTAAMYTLGTGVGGGLILGGRLFLGGLGNGGEMGHMPLVDGGEPCTCGLKGCVESYCSATALIRDAKRAMLENKASSLWELAGQDPVNLDAKIVIDAAKAGDKTALAVFHAYVGHLGSAIVGLLHVLDLEKVAIGGGVSGAGDFLLAPLQEDVHRKCFFRSHGEVVLAATGNQAGIIGAAMLDGDQGL